MPSLTSYKGLQVLTPDPTGAGGLAIQEDFKTLVDWQPKSVWGQSADPTAGDDENDDFFPGSCWLRTNVTPPRLFVCQSSGVGAAVWRPVLLKVVQDTSPVLGGALDAGAFKITNLADPTAAQDAATKAYVDSHSGGGSVSKYSVAVGNGSATSIVVTHNLGSRSVVVSVTKTASPYASVLCEWKATSVNTITLEFSVAPATDEFTVTVIG